MDGFVPWWLCLHLIGHKQKTFMLMLFNVYTKKIINIYAMEHHY